MASTIHPEHAFSAGPCRRPHLSAVHCIPSSTHAALGFSFNTHSIKNKIKLHLKLFPGCAFSFTRLPLLFSPYPSPQRLFPLLCDLPRIGSVQPHSPLCPVAFCWSMATPSAASLGASTQHSTSLQAAFCSVALLCPSPCFDYHFFPPYFIPCSFRIPWLSYSGHHRTVPQAGALKNRHSSHSSGGWMSNHGAGRAGSAEATLLDFPLCPHTMPCSPVSLCLCTFLIS